MGPELGLVAVAVERHRARQHEVQHAAERVDVSPGVDLAAADLLGRGEVERANPAIGLGQACRRKRLLGEPEV